MAYRLSEAPDFVPMPTITINGLAGNHLRPPPLTSVSPCVHSSQYHTSFKIWTPLILQISWQLLFFQFIYDSPRQTHHTTYPPPSNYYRPLYNNRQLYRNESDGQPRNPALNYDGEGVCEIVLVTIFIFLWICSIHRLYSVWKNTLGFSEASIQGPQGWDLLFNWIQEMIASQKKKASLYLSDLKVFTVVTCVLIKFLLH